MIARRLSTSIVIPCLLAIWAPGCLEHEVKTTINPDGTCERTITLHPESQKFPTTCFPLPIDRGWDTSWTKTGDGKYLVRFTKKFRDCEELSHEYVHPPDSMKIPLSLRVQKSFRWFYTYYDYAESYGRFTDYTLIDPRTVLTEDEIRRLTYGDSSKTLSYKRDEWVARNLYEVLYRHVAQGAEAMRDSLLTPATMAAHKEELFRRIVGWTGPGSKLQDPNDILKEQSSYRGSKATLLTDSSITDDGVNAFAEVAAGTFKSEAVWKLKDQICAGWQDALRMLKGKGTTGESFTNAVILPGILLETNATDVMGSSASWKFSVDQLQLRTFEMQARSRMVNEWAIAVTGAIVLILLVFLVLSLIRRSRQAALNHNGPG
jgi:hypothetical protein